MPDKRHRRNLPPEAEPWGRAIDGAVDEVALAVERLRQDNINSFKGINSTMSAISQSLNDLSTLTQQLSAQQAALTSAQASLANQQATLTSTVTRLDQVAANEVTGASTSNSNSSPITVGNGGLYVGASATVPAGFTRAVVMAVSSIRITGSANMALYLSVSINGNNGITFPVFGESGSSATTAAAASHAATLTGLSTGQTITIWGRTTSVSGVSGAYFSNAASITFLK